MSISTPLSQAVWIVIESVSPIQVPIITYERADRVSQHAQSKFNPDVGQTQSINWGPGIPMDLGFRVPRMPLYLEPQNFIKNPEQLVKPDNLNTIRLVGIYLDFDTAQNIASSEPNRKLLGPGIPE